MIFHNSQYKEAWIPEVQQIWRDQIFLFRIRHGKCTMRNMSEHENKISRTCGTWIESIRISEIWSVWREWYVESIEIPDLNFSKNFFPTRALFHYTTFKFKWDTIVIKYCLRNFANFLLFSPVKFRISSPLSVYVISGFMSFPISGSLLQT